ncbi:MAG: hypothetical protein CM15mP36_01630 [Flavobacteriales bacterium]|nr:MAG: hypothetical protein CM15mP36_01630 [Flavobacteriales bacterium]
MEIPNYSLFCNGELVDSQNNIDFTMVFNSII